LEIASYKLEMNHSFEKLNESINSIKSLEFNDQSEYMDFKDINAGSGLKIASFEKDIMDQCEKNLKGYRKLSHTSKGKSAFNST